MIRTLCVSNFRSLGEDVRIDFERLTALVGPNGSGKSNVVDALRFVADATTQGLAGAITHRHGMPAVRRWSGGHPFNVALRLELALPDGPAGYEFELTGARSEEFRVKREELRVVLEGGEHGLRVEQGRWVEGPRGCDRPWTGNRWPCPW